MLSRPQSPSRLANLAATKIEAAFSDFRHHFRVITRRAQYSFERRDWARHQSDATERLLLYRRAVDRVEEQLRHLLDDRVQDRLVWVSTRAVYSGLIAHRQDWELAETFFNSASRRIFDTVGVDPFIEFVDSDFDHPPAPATLPCWLRQEAADAPTLARAVLDDRFPSLAWEHHATDVRHMAERFEDALGPGPYVAELLVPTFFRGKGAYLVGRLTSAAGQRPLVVALRNGRSGLRVDALLLEESDLSVLFSYTRSYFQVDVSRPHDVVEFLQELLPHKPRGELYIAIGEPKQGKTELFRALLGHLSRHPEERFVHAEGVPGLVMVVFNLPGHDVVLKVIRDRFPPQKTVTLQEVKSRYQWVHLHDRAGRLLDAQPFEQLLLPQRFFSPELLADLLAACGRTVHLEGDNVVIDLAYVERRITPLDVFVRRASPDDARKAIVEMGKAIRDLAACNIFPGDLLPKNFGVTRSGRVAFYDYDELCELTSRRFRAIPPSTSYEDEVSSEPWYSVAPEDVFPEEWPRFLGLPRPLKETLLAEHGDLFGPDWWIAVQERILAGKIVEFVPYPPDRRLSVARPAVPRPSAPREP